jgi:hypothetical protein
MSSSKKIKKGYKPVPHHDRHRHPRPITSDTKAAISTKFVITNQIDDGGIMGGFHLMYLVYLAVVLVVIAGGVLGGLYGTGYLSLPTSSSSPSIPLDYNISSSSSSSSSGIGLNPSSSSSSSSTGVVVPPFVTSSSSTTGLFACPVDQSICNNGGQGTNPLVTDKRGGVRPVGVTANNVQLCMNGLSSLIVGKALGDGPSTLNTLNAYILPNNDPTPCNILCCNTPGCRAASVNNQPVTFQETNYYGATDLNNPSFVCSLKGKNSGSYYVPNEYINSTTFSRYPPPESNGNAFTGYTCQQGAFPMVKGVTPDYSNQIGSIRLSQNGDMFLNPESISACLTYCGNNNPSCKAVALYENDKDYPSCDIFSTSITYPADGTRFSIQVLPNVIDVPVCTPGIF